MAKTHVPAVNSPGPNDRTLVVGRTGSGKTVAGLFHLSRSNFDQMPWVIINSKGDEHLNSIQGVKEIDVSSPAPYRPGMYMLRPLPHETEELEQFLWRVHAQGNIGLYIDEGYMVAPLRPASAAFRAILTQGRSLRIPIIMNSQKPKWIETFAVSEADFYQVFNLNDAKDRQRIGEFIPKRDGVDLDRRLTQYYSWYYDVKSDTLHMLKPLQAPEKSIEEIDKKLDLINRTSNTVKLRAI